MTKTMPDMTKTMPDMKCKRCGYSTFIQINVETIKYTGHINNHGEMDLATAKPYHLGVEKWGEYVCCGCGKDIKPEDLI